VLSCECVMSPHVACSVCFILCRVVECPVFLCSEYVTFLLQAYVCFAFRYKAHTWIPTCVLVFVNIITMSAQSLQFWSLVFNITATFCSSNIMCSSTIPAWYSALSKVQDHIHPSITVLTHRIPSPMKLIVSFTTSLVIRYWIGICTKLPGCICLQNDLYCARWGVKFYSL